LNPFWEIGAFYARRAIFETIVSADRKKSAARCRRTTVKLSAGHLLNENYLIRHNVAELFPRDFFNHFIGMDIIDLLTYISGQLFFVVNPRLNLGRLHIDRVYIRQIAVNGVAKDTDNTNKHGDMELKF
jgi:hypothetical protein